MLSAIRNLDYVIVPCRDYQAMRRFYIDTLGFPVYRDRDDMDWLELRAGSSLLTIRPRGVLPWDGPGPEAGSAGLQLAFRVTPAQVDACHAELVARGVPILEPPADKPWGHRTLFFNDPDGNVVEIYADL